MRLPLENDVVPRRTVIGLDDPTAPPTGKDRRERPERSSRLIMACRSCAALERPATWSENADRDVEGHVRAGHDAGRGRGDLAGQGGTICRDRRLRMVNSLPSVPGRYTPRVRKGARVILTSCGSRRRRVRRTDARGDARGGDRAAGRRVYLTVREVPSAKADGKTVVRAVSLREHDRRRWRRTASAATSRTRSDGRDPRPAFEKSYGRAIRDGVYVHT